jgi:hypothetical protein
MAIFSCLAKTFKFYKEDLVEALGSQTDHPGMSSRVFGIRNSYIK